MKPSQSVRFITLGCRVNQYETQAMKESLESIGLVDRNASELRQDQSEVDYVVINTCTVTEAADKENLYWIRRAKREHPQAKIIVTGCFVQRNRSEVETIPEVDLVLDNFEKDDIAERVKGCGSPEVQNDLKPAKKKHEYGTLSISRSEGRIRAYIKVQDGCNHACSFCKVVLVRGRSRSRPLEAIIEEAKRLRDAGHKEIVLAGIQLGAYGLDLEKKQGLEVILEVCHQIEGIERIRLSSIEPTDVRPEVIRALKDLPKCCPHLHIPLQSGDNEILRKMNRRYDRSFYLDLISRLRSEVPNFSLTLDVMAGFPDEEEKHFMNTVDLLTQVRPLKCHVFPYSRRNGTKATALADLSPEVIRDRVRRLIALGEHLGQAESELYRGKVKDVLVERKMKKGKLLQGVTNNYLKVCFQGDERQMGQLVPVELLAYQGGIFLGRNTRNSTDGIA